MKKFIKEYLTYLMSVTILLTSMPFGVLAAGVPVEVNINGVAFIEYVATIIAPIDININESNKGLGYIHVENNSNVYLKAKVSDIVATTEDEPSNFVAADSKDWNSLSAEDTKKYISFEIAGSKYTIEDKNTSKIDVYQKKGTLYPAGTENYQGVDLGVLSSDTTCDGCLKAANGSVSYAGAVFADQKYYTLEATVGYKWEKDTKLSYNIVILTESFASKKETYVNYDPDATTLNGHYLNFRLKDVGDAYITLNKTGGTVNPKFNADLYIVTDGTDNILRYSEGKTTLAEAPESEYTITYSWRHEIGGQNMNAAFKIANIDDDVYIYVSSIKEMYSEDGEGAVGNGFTDAINNYKERDIIYIPYTVTISHTDSSSKKVDMIYTYEDVALVYFRD